ncbi:MAG TPA: ribosome biogenesis GTPase Der [Syntrophobacteraceae bacterium]|nr:ribosome biogenesis GTPase Der [Syntrophobacteraceae bacterium]
MALVAIVGRPNVGKSTLFNRICGRRQALVDDFPGVTRDRIYAQATWDARVFTLMDTAGFVTADATTLEDQTRQQVILAIEEADTILFLADAKAGLHPEDEVMVDLLRRSSKPTVYAVNKVDGSEQNTHLSEFYRLGVEALHPISAAHGHGVGDLLDLLTKDLPALEGVGEAAEGGQVRIALVGRPNVGKSTLVNTILKAPRVIVSEVPGTTRDAVDTPFVQNGQECLLIDTAGIRRKGRTSAKLEKISILKALQSIERSHVAIVVVNAAEGITDQDLHIAGYVRERHRGCVVVLNKWDLVDLDQRRRKKFLDEARERLRFMPYAPLMTASAITGKRVSQILPTVLQVFEEYGRRMNTSSVNQALETAVQLHEPPYVGQRRLKFYYASQTSVRPPTFVLFCNYPQSIHFSYERYLTNYFREAFGLNKTPLRLIFRPRSRKDR